MKLNSRGMFVAAVGAAWSFSVMGAAQYTVAGSLDAPGSAELIVIDGRPPAAQLARKVVTPQGEAERLEDSAFEQMPIEALRGALAEQLDEQLRAKLSGQLRLTALNVAVGERLGRPATRAEYAPFAVGGLIGGLIASRAVPAKVSHDGPLPLYVDLTLDHQGRPVACKAMATFYGDSIGSAWQAALREAVVRCAHQLGVPKMLEEAGPNRVR